MKSSFIALEAKKWVSEKLIDASQARKICNKYGVDFDNPKQKTKGYNTLITLGYLFIGIALIILISENWEEIPRMLKTSVLITTTLGINIVALLKYKTDRSKANTLFFLGGLIYGTSIILIAQIYHLGEHMPDGIWWWAIGLLPFALLSKSNYLMALPFILGSIWFTMEWSEFDNYKISYLLFIILSIYSLYKDHKDTLFFVGTSIATFMFLLATTNYFIAGSSVLAVLSFLLIFYAFSFFLESLNSDKFKDYGKILKNLALLAISINLLTRTYSEFWGVDFNQFFFTITALISIPILLYYKQSIVAISWGTILLLHIFIQTLIGQSIYPLYMQVFYSFIFMAFSIGLIISGINKSLAYYFFLGIINVLLFAFSRYLDLFGDDYIGTSVLFIALAVILLGSAKYWRVVNDK
ncbi:hypothetical protein MNB_SUP05-SYMBIONT-5-130 [hydrothermal vent metagenome]|uniref:DUF2157 domain-containing protein n=1 Tax=hydrothermal vent metagenome TaxID=652676 RepID=A0A1W1E1Y5_9ZZZZ